MFKPHFNSLCKRTGRLAADYTQARIAWTDTLREMLGDMVHDGSPLPKESLADPRCYIKKNNCASERVKRRSPGAEEKSSVDVDKIKGHDKYSIFVLGAGASKGAGFPICRDFFSTPYLNSIGINLDPPLDGRGLSSKGIEELLMDAYASDREQFNSLTKYYEKVFFNADSKFKNVTGEIPPKQWMWIVMHYFFLISYFLEASASGKNVVVISFNHDLCVEELMRNQGYNYGTITNRMYSVGKYPGLPRFGYDFTLLKLHGSFNFSHCSSCNAIWCEQDWVWDKGNDWPCGVCGKLGNNFYVPPSVIKDVSKLEESWEDAEYFLTRAEEVFVVGYSLPSYDSHAVQLFEKTNPNSSLAIVDPYAYDILDRYANTIPSKDRYFVNKSWHEFTQDMMYEFWPFIRF